MFVEQGGSVLVLVREVVGVLVLEFVYDLIRVGRRGELHELRGGSSLDLQVGF